VTGKSVTRKKNVSSELSNAARKKQSSAERNTKQRRQAICFVARLMRSVLSAVISMVLMVAAVPVVAVALTEWMAG
jgi:hypothetical protein